MGAFAEMLGDVRRICDINNPDLARICVSFYNDDAKRTKGTYRQRTQEAWGHTAHRSLARLLLDRDRPGPHHPRTGASRCQRRGDADG